VWSNVTIPLLLDVPVLFPGAGGYALTYPVKAGDEGLVILASRCIDSWWTRGGVQAQAELRMHDLSDGFFLPGFRSNPRKLTGFSNSVIRMTTDDGSQYVELDKDAGRVNVVVNDFLYVNGQRVRTD
jgi:hypothetical protein